MSSHRVAYRCLAKDTEARVTANAVTVVGGQIISGAVADTRVINQIYLQVDESDGKKRLARRLAIIDPNISN